MHHKGGGGILIKTLTRAQDLKLGAEESRFVQDFMRNLFISFMENLKGTNSPVIGEDEVIETTREIFPINMADLALNYLS